MELERGRSVVRHELFQEAMGAMCRLGEELASVDSRLEAEGLRLAEERCKLKVAINLGRHLRDLENAKAEASLKVSHEACSRALDEAREADRRCEAAVKRAWELQAWSASLEQQVEARRAAPASLRGTPAEEEEVRKREEALALEAVERRLELERLRRGSVKLPMQKMSSGLTRPESRRRLIAGWPRVAQIWRVGTT